MPTETTIYNVITRFRTEERGSSQAGRGMDEFERKTRRARRQTEGLGLSLGLLGRYVGPAAALGAAFSGATLGIRNLNEEVERSTQLAAQFNLAFRFDADPTKNFLASLTRARVLTAGIVKDAAALPGSTRDFFGSAGMLALPTFSAGRSAEDLRRLVGKVALGAPFAGVRQDVGAQQAYRILSGQASMGDNNLFAALVPAGLNKGINQMSAAKRFEELDRVLSKLVDNPIFRKRVSATLETQLSTMSDLLFGSRGIFGQTVGLSGYDAMVATITSLNETLETNIPAIVGYLRWLGESARETSRVAGAAAPENRWERARKFWAARGEEIEARRIARTLSPDVWVKDKTWMGMQVPDWFHEWRRDWAIAPERSRDILVPTEKQDRLTGFIQNGLSTPGTNPEIFRAAVDQVAAMEGRSGMTAMQMMASIEAAYEKLSEKGTLTFGSNVTQQTFVVKIDLKSDTSPEGIAVKFQKGMERATRAPRRSSRGLPAGPSPASGR